MSMIHTKLERIDGQLYMVVYVPIEHTLVAYENRIPKLTPQGRRVFDMLINGKCNKEIAQELNITERTAKHHVSKVFAILGINSRTELLGVLYGKGEQQSYGRNHRNPISEPAPGVHHSFPAA